MKKALLILILSLITFSLFSFVVSAQTTTTDYFGLKAVEEAKLNLPKDSPAAFTARIVRWVVGILGVILIGVIVYGGVLYATAAGSEERAGTAKKVLTYAIIGLAIVATAFIVSDYVVGALYNTQTLSKSSTSSSSSSSSSGTSSSSSVSLPDSGKKSEPGAFQGYAEFGAPCDSQTTCKEGSCVLPEVDQGALKDQKFCLYNLGADCSTQSTSGYTWLGMEVANVGGCAKPYICRPWTEEEKKTKDVSGISTKFDGKCIEP